MPSDAFLKLANTGHRALLKLSGGRIGWEAKGMPLLELTTIGRRSGQPRKVMVAAPIHEDDRYVLVGSRGGDDIDPAWVHNLRAQPAVEVMVKGARRPMRARVADGRERVELWARIAEDQPHFAAYQAKTTRELPLVVLEPI